MAAFDARAAHKAFATDVALDTLHLPPGLTTEHHAGSAPPGLKLPFVSGRTCCPVFRPPPGLTNCEDIEMSSPPGNFTHQRQLADMQPLRIELGSLAAMSPLLTAYPLKPPGIFTHTCDTFSSASTSVSETGEDNDEIPEVSRLLPEALQPKDEMPKEFSRELHVEPMDMACGKPLKVHWPVDSKKLQSRDKQIVSSLFEVSPGCLFKLMLKPKVMGDKRHQEGFQRARGLGSIELKCVEGAALAPTLRFWISVGDGSLRGPVTHNFNESTVSGLINSDGSFDFRSAV